MNYAQIVDKLIAEREELRAELARLRALLTRAVDHVSYGSRRSYDGVGGYKMREAASQLLLEIMAALAALYRAAPPAQPAEPVQRLSDERAAFEAWHNEYRTQELVRRDDTYYNTHVRCRWEGWQARAIESALQPGWRDIESEPKDGTQYLACDGKKMWTRNQPPNCYAGDWECNQNRTLWRGHADGLNPTHWMPLPAAPKD